MKKRPIEITNKFLQIIEENLKDLISGKTDEYLDIFKIADHIHINATHLSNTIKETTGKSPCDICNEKTIAVAKILLEDKNLTIAEIAFKLTYEPTNFTKYFKKFVGLTPSQYRKSKIQEP
jgi:AraC family transcriptional regulator of adaptative response / methylphosphotriester-DNA alkyltransferase methyltransferase